jgi:UDP-N-acetylmuramoyl-tripeptide--D-alanyl-D-alanine ligase
MSTPIPANSALLTASAAAAATGGCVASGSGAGRPARGIVSDSRSVTPGCAFVALRGQRCDGHDYVDSAIRAGAVLVLVERGRAPRSVSADVVEVDDTLRAWSDLARAHVRAWRAAKLTSTRAVFAITGSAGKTTTKEFCAALCARLGGTHGTAGNLNNRIGVPAVAFGLGAEHRFGVFEIGMSVRGEIAALAAAIEPNVAIITNIGLAHAGGVGGTRADVAREKGDLFAALGAEGVAVTCFDDEAAMGQIDRTPARRVVTFGSGAGADYRLLERGTAEWAGSRMRFARRSGGPVSWANLPIPGEAAALDFLAALAAVEAFGGRLSADAIDAALAGGIKPPPGRMQARVLRSGTTILDDTYNANPESVRAALRTLGELARGRRAVVVLGEMCELGPSGGAEHERLGGAVAKCGAHVIVSCGGLADRTALEAERAGVHAIRAPDVEAAARGAVAIVAPGDVVLVKASRSVEAERVVHALVVAGGGDSAPPVGAI